MGLGVSLVPEALDNLPPAVKSILGSGIATGGFVAIGMSLALPESRSNPH